MRHHQNLHHYPPFPLLSITSTSRHKIYAPHPARPSPITLQCAVEHAECLLSAAANAPVPAAASLLGGWRPPLVPTLCYFHYSLINLDSGVDLAHKEVASIEPNRPREAEEAK